MELKPLAHSLTICKVAEITGIDLNRDFYFLSKTDEEISLVCNTEDTPREVLTRDDGWRAFRIQGILDFSLVGVLSKISASDARPAPTSRSVNGPFPFARSTRPRIILRSCWTERMP